MEKSKEILLKGLPIAPGLVIGKALVWKHKRIKPSRKVLPEKERPIELENFRKTRDIMLQDLEKLKKNLPPRITRFVDFQIAVLKDGEFLKDVEYLIKEKGRTAEYAVYEAIEDRMNELLKSGIEYYRDRAKELETLYFDFVSYLRNEEKREVIGSDVVIFADDITIEESIRIVNSDVKAVVLQEGGKTSHAAIILRDYRIPAVFGVGDFSDKVDDGNEVIINGWKGEVIINPSEPTLERFRELVEKYKEEAKGLIEIKDLPTITTDGRGITLMANIDLPEEISLVLEEGAHGIGLFRTELLFYEYGDDEKEQEGIYRDICEQIYPFSCIIRAFDLGGDKVIKGYREKNPFLGLRGIRLLLEEEERFRKQIRAVLRANVKGNVKFMIPMVTTLWEVKRSRAIFLEEARKLSEKEEIKLPDFGIMVEVPSAALTINSMADYIDFVSIGTNDLTQYTLAVDRRNTRVSYLFHHTHPAVLRLIKMVVDAGREHSFRVGVCGEISSDPVGIILLLGLGITELSLTPSLVLQTKKLIRRISIEEVEKLAEGALSLADGDEVTRVVLDYIKDRAPDIVEKYGHF